MKLSIIVPVYNAEKYIQDCLESILEQKCTDYEIVLVNDGSKDASDEICNMYAQSHDNITVIHKENEGTYQARLDGARVARGEYVWYVDPDDWILTNSIQKLMTLLNDFKDIDVLISNYCVNGTQKFIKEFPKNEVNYKQFVQEKLCQGYEYNSLCWECIRRELITNNSELYDIKRFCYAEDAYMNACILELASTVKIVDDIFYSYRIVQSGITAHYNPLCVDNNKITFKKLFSMAKKIDVINHTNLEKDVAEKQSNESFCLVYMLMKSKISWDNKVYEYNKLLKDPFIKEGIENEVFNLDKWWKKYIFQMVKLKPNFQIVFLKIGEMITQCITLLKSKARN